MARKKTSALIALVMVFAVLLAACGSTTNNTAEQTSTESSVQNASTQPAATQSDATQPAVKTGFKMALLDGTNQNAWRTQCEDEMNQLADQLKTQGIITKYDTFVANNDPTLQAQQMEQLVNAGVDAIFINPVSATALTPVIEKAIAKNILVFGIDQHINHPKVISVTNDQYKWAQIQAEWLVKQINGKGNIFWFDAIKGAPASDIRSQAFKDVLDKNPGIKVLKQVNGDWDEGKGKQLMQQLISTFPEYDAVLTQDGNAVGILSAVQEAGKPLPKAITSDEIVQYIKLWHDINTKNPDNKLNAIIVENPPGIGADAMKIAVRLLQGKKLKDSALTSDAGDPGNKNALMITPELIITNDNLEEYYQKYKDANDNSYIDNILTDEQIDQYFQ